MVRLRTALLLALVGAAGVVVVEAQSMQLLMCKPSDASCEFTFCRNSSSSTGWCACGVDDGCSCECPESGCKAGGDYPCSPGHRCARPGQRRASVPMTCLNHNTSKSANSSAIHIS